jgi:hypothetical protein
LELLYLQPEIPEVLEVPENLGKPGKTTLIAYTYLTVRNAQGRSVATDVEVFVKDAYVSKPLTDVPSRHFGLGDLALKWSNTQPKTTRASVPPGAERRLDFLRVENGRDAQGRLPLIVYVLPEPVHERHHVRGATVIFELLLTASNADAKGYTVQVNFDGTFPAESVTDAHQLWQHLTIVRPQPK